MIYDILTATSGLYLKRVSFVRVQEELEKIATPVKYQPLLSQLRNIMNLMTREDTIE